MQRVRTSPPEKRVAEVPPSRREVKSGSFGESASSDMRLEAYGVPVRAGTELEARYMHAGLAAHALLQGVNQQGQHAPAGDELHVPEALALHVEQRRAGELGPQAVVQKRQV